MMMESGGGHKYAITHKCSITHKYAITHRVPSPVTSETHPQTCVEFPPTLTNCSRGRSPTCSFFVTRISWPAARTPALSLESETPVLTADAITTVYQTPSSLYHFQCKFHHLKCKLQSFSMQNSSVPILRRVTLIDHSDRASRHPTPYPSATCQNITKFSPKSR